MATAMVMATAMATATESMVMAIMKKMKVPHG